MIRGVIRLACDQAPALEIVAEVETGEEARRRAAAASDPDVLLLDLSLPGELQGLDVARTARAERLATRILVLSGARTTPPCSRASGRAPTAS